MWIDGVIICNDDKGIVRIVTDSSVTKVEGRRWMATALVFEAAEDILHVVPAADLAVVRRLLELCHHRISPGSVGTTIIYLLTDAEQPAGRCRDDGVRVEAMKLSCSPRSRAAGAAPGEISGWRDAGRPWWTAAGGERDPVVGESERRRGAGDERHAPHVGRASHLRLPDMLASSYPRMGRSPYSATASGSPI